MGFELRCDGQERISRASIKKHIERMRAEIDALLKVICPGGSGTRHPIQFATLRRSAIQIIRSAHARITGMSSGKLHRQDDARRWLSKCWLAGFLALKWNPGGTQRRGAIALVPIQPNLAEWLTKFRVDSGEVYYSRRRFREAYKSAGVPEGGMDVFRLHVDLCYRLVAQPPPNSHGRRHNGSCGAPPHPARGRRDGTDSRTVRCRRLRVVVPV